MELTEKQIKELWDISQENKADNKELQFEVESEIENHYEIKSLIQFFSNKQNPSTSYYDEILLDKLLVKLKGYEDDLLTCTNNCVC